MTQKRDARILTPPDDGESAAKTPAFDPAIFLTHPQRAAEAWLAASQTLLQGMQEVSRRHLMLQSALIEQAMTGALSFFQLAQPGAKPEAVTASVQQATETAVQSMREIMTAACKCSTDALAVYRDRMAGSESLDTGRAEPPHAAAG